MRVPVPRHSDSGQWETIRYALDSNVRTIRLCFILVIGSSALAATLMGLMPHLLSKL
jgi:hypothetical protein